MRHAQPQGGGNTYLGPAHTILHLYREHSCSLCISLTWRWGSAWHSYLSKPGKLQQSQRDKCCRYAAIMGLIFQASWKILTTQDGNVPHLTNHPVLARSSTGVRGATPLFMRLSSPGYDEAIASWSPCSKKHFHCRDQTRFYQ